MAYTEKELETARLKERINRMVELAANADHVQKEICVAAATIAEKKILGVSSRIFDVISDILRGEYGFEMDSKEVERAVDDILHCMH